MSNVIPEPLDVNTPDGFSAALAAKLGGDPNAPVPGPSGSDPTAPAPAAPAVAPAPPAVGDDDFMEVADEWVPLLERYGGDINEVFKALNEAQSTIGRQGNDLGKENADLRRRIEALESGGRPAQAVPLGIITPELEQQLEASFEDHQNPSALMYQIVSAYPGDTNIYEAAIKAWGQTDPFSALRYDQMYRAELEKITSPVVADSTIQDIKQERNLMAAGEAAAVKYPDWATLETVIDKAYARVDASVRSMIVSDDAAQRAAGMDILVQYARVDKAALDAAPASATDPLAASRVAAQVATGSQSGTVGTPDEAAERVKQFKETTFGVPSTSIAAELARQSESHRT